MDGDRGTDQRARRSRRTVLVLLATALPLYGVLLLMERGGPSPVQRLSESSAAQPVGGAIGPVPSATIFGHTPKFAATISGAAPTSQITTTDAGPAEAICQEFGAGTGTTLSSVVYSTKGTTISKVLTPGQFLYWVSVQAPSAGLQTFTITQSTTYAPTTGSPNFTLGSGSSAYDASCNPLSTSVAGGTAGSPNVTVTFNAPAAGTYVIGIKETTHSILGSSPASTTSGFSYTYTFATTGVSGSTQTLSLTHQ